jgi:hypothetical protein
MQRDYVFRGGMSKYLYTLAAKIDDVTPRQQKPPQHTATSAKTTS